jgi:hypothetical protein
LAIQRFDLQTCGFINEFGIERFTLSELFAEEITSILMALVGIGGYERSEAPTSEPITAEKALIHAESILVKLPQRYQNSHRIFYNLLCSKLGLLPKPGERCEFSDLAGERFVPYRQNIRQVTANRYFEC